MGSVQGQKSLNSYITKDHCNIGDSSEKLGTWSTHHNLPAHDRLEGIIFWWLSLSESLQGSSADLSSFQAAGLVYKSSVQVDWSENDFSTNYIFSGKEVPSESS